MFFIWVECECVSSPNTTCSPTSGHLVMMWAIWGVSVGWSLAFVAISLAAALTKPLERHRWVVFGDGARAQSIASLQFYARNGNDRQKSARKENVSKFILNCCASRIGKLMQMQFVCTCLAWNLWQMATRERKIRKTIFMAFCTRNFLSTHENCDMQRGQDYTTNL